MKSTFARATALTVVASSLVACGQAGQATPTAPAPPQVLEPAPPPPPPPAPVGRQPPAGLAEAWGATCTWTETAAGGVSIWGYACDGDRLVADPALPGIVRELSTNGVVEFNLPIVQVFAKPADADISAVLPAVVLASPGAEGCAFVPSALGDWFELMPTGDAMVAYQAWLDGTANEPGLPCGELGPTEAGLRSFHLFENRPDIVAVLHQPSDFPTFDIDSLKAN